MATFVDKKGFVINHEMNANKALSVYRSSKLCPRGQTSLEVQHLHDHLLSPVLLYLCERKHPDMYEDVKHPDVDIPAKTRPSEYPSRDSPHSLR